MTQKSIREEWESFSKCGCRSFGDVCSNCPPKGAISDWWLSKIREIIEIKSRELDEAEVSYDKDIDITDIPDELRAEMTGMKKGWKAGLTSLLEELT